MATFSGKFMHSKLDSCEQLVNVWSCMTLAYIAAYRLGLSICYLYQVKPIKTDWIDGRE